MPFDSQAQRESAELGNEGADTRADLTAKYQSAQNQLGFGTGALNPYSRAAENREALQTSRRATLNTAGNHLYSGSTLNALSAARSAYDKNQKSIEQQIAESQSAYNRGIASTGRDEALGRATIEEGAIQRAASATPEPLGVGRGRGRRNRGRGRPPAPRATTPRARAIGARVNARRGRR